jgi:hypothetical protein
MRSLTATAVLMLAYRIGVAVDLVISPSTQVEAKCPGTQGTYEVAVAGGSTLPTCVYTWSIIGGTISGQTTGQSVSVTWDDSSGRGTLVVTAGNCTIAENNGSYDSAKYTRMSVFNRSWPNPSGYLSTVEVPLCSPPAYVDIGVDHLYVQNTGGIAEPPLKEVDLYKWAIPAGWTEYWTSTPGPANINTAINSLRLVPTSAVGGSIVVTGYVTITCPGTLGSKTKTITLTRSPAVSVVPPGGFTSATCGLKDPLTFTATYVACATNYSWQRPPGWLGASSTNSITLTPNGANGGDVTVSITLNTGYALSKTYTVTFSNATPPNPTLTDNSNNFELCSGETRIYTVTPPSGFPTNYGFQYYFYYPQGAGLLIEGQNTSQASPYVTTSNQVTVSCPGSAYGSAFLMARMAASGCTPSGWVNLETRAGVYNSDEFSILGPQQVCPNTAVDFTASLIGGAVLGHQWTVPNGWQASGLTTPYLHLSVPWEFSGGEAITLRLQNRCGTTNTPNVKPIFVGYGCGFFMSENPVSADLTITSVDTKRKFSARLVNDHSATVRESTTGEGKIHIDTRDLPNGVYIVEVTAGDSVEKRRILVRH